MNRVEKPSDRRPGVRGAFGVRLQAAAQRAGDPGRRWDPRVDPIVMGGLAAFTLLTRIPHRTRYLNGWDSALFALGMEDYDIPSARPHPPGYPVYLALAKLLQAFTGEANAALVLLSMLASVASVALLYGLIREVGSMRAAIGAALLFSLTPFFLFNGVIALSYTCEAAAALGVAWLAWRTRDQPSVGRATLLGASWSLAIGLRQSLLFFVSPLVLYALLGSQRMSAAALRRIGAAGMAATATTLAWFVPMVLATGGFGPWRKATGLQSGWVVFSESVFTKGWPALVDHWDRLVYYVHYEVVLLLALLALIGLSILAVRTNRGAIFTRPAHADRKTAVFLAWWLLPALFFYLLVFNGWDRGPTGYVLVLLPGVYAIYAWTGDALIRRIEREASPPGLRRSAALLALPLLLLPGPALHAGWSPLLEQETRGHDAWADSWSRLPDSFPPQETAILAWYSWTHVKWYFPDYLLWSYMPIPGRGPPDWILTLQTQDHADDRAYYDAHFLGPNQKQHTIPAHVKRVILFDFQLAGEGGWHRRLTEAAVVQEASLDNGWRVLYFEPENLDATIESYFHAFPNAATLDG